MSAHIETLTDRLHRWADEAADAGEDEAAKAFDGAALLAEQDASEIATLRAEVARLTADLIKSNERGAVVSIRARSAEDALAASRALADRLAEALRAALDSWSEYSDPGAEREEISTRRAVLREWEEARRGSEGVTK